MKDHLPPFPEMPGLNGKSPVQAVVAGIFFGMLAKEIAVHSLATPVGFSFPTFFTIGKTTIFIAISIILFQKETEKR